MRRPLATLPQTRECGHQGETLEGRRAPHPGRWSIASLPAVYRSGIKPPRVSPVLGQPVAGARHHFVYEGRRDGAAPQNRVNPASGSASHPGDCFRGQGANSLAMPLGRIVVGVQCSGNSSLTRFLLPIINHLEPAFADDVVR